MRVERLREIASFHIDRVAAATRDDPAVLRMENLDTDVRPPQAAIEATRKALDEDEGNSWLPFTGRDDLKEAVATYIERRRGPRYATSDIVITCGEGDAMLDALFCLTDPGDEVVLTDPTYAGMLNRVRLAGAVPRLTPLAVVDGEWRLDLDALRASVTRRTKVVFVNIASFPSGWAATTQEVEAIAGVCRHNDAWLLYWSGFEGVRYDGESVPHPAALDGMRERTVIVGCPTFEQRMIAWRIGWVVAPPEVASDVAQVHIYNGLTPSSFAQMGTRVALQAQPDDLAQANAEWQRRRDETLRQLHGLPAVKAAGGWSLLLDVAALGLDCVEVSNRLLQQKVAATPMRGWGGDIAARHVRFVFSNEPVDRLAALGQRVRAALG
jgi:aspartate/methionine/tyrosine aminotransferase